MNTIEAIKTRRSCRKYKSEQIKEEDLIKVLEAGTYAPTGYGSQEPWIVAVQDEDTLNIVRKLNAKFWGGNISPVIGKAASTVGYDTYYGAPTIILVFAEKDNENGVKDGSLVLGTMMLAAHELGLGTCWINREDKMFATDEGKELMKKFGLPDGLMGVGALSIGYWNTEPKEPKPRKKDYYRIIK